MDHNFSNQNFTKVVGEKRHLKVTKGLLCTIFSCFFLVAYADEDKGEEKPLHHQVKYAALQEQGIGVNLPSKRFDTRYLKPLFYKQPLPSDHLINANGSGDNKLILSEKIDTLPVVCVQSGSTKTAMPYTWGKREITSQDTITTRAVIFSLKESNGRTYDYIHIGQDYHLVPFSDLDEDKKQSWVDHRCRVKLFEVSAKPILPEGLQGTILISASSPGTTTSSREITDSIGVSIGTEVDASATPGGKATVGFTYGHQVKYSIPDVAVMNDSGRGESETVWKYEIGNIHCASTKTSFPSRGGLSISAQWIWRIDHAAAIENGLYTKIGKGKHTFSFQNKVGSEFKVYRGKYEPLTSTHCRPDDVVFDAITFLIPSEPKGNTINSLYLS